jgi:homoaconitase/3-isopropylmalate dehydratase large subunit
MGVYAKDVILKIIGELSSSKANYKSLEFYGETVKQFSISSRMTVCNMVVEMGAKAGIVPTDETTKKYLEARTQNNYQTILSDPQANYLEEFSFDISDLEPQVACPHEVDNVKGISDLADIQIHQGFIGSCTNGRLEDLQIVAKVLENQKIQPGVRLIVCPASKDIYLHAIQNGTIETIVKAGGVILNPGCGPCLGAHQGVLASGETAISTSNRNFRGRMGSPDAEIYLASPATVAASAIFGEITNPNKIIK